MITWQITTWVPRTRYHATFVGRDETGQWWRRPLLCDRYGRNVRLDAVPVAHTVLEPEAVDCRVCRRALEWAPRFVLEMPDTHGRCDGCGRQRWSLQPISFGTHYRWRCLTCRERGAS